MFKKILILFLSLSVMVLSFAAPDPSPIIPGMGEFDTLAAEGAGLPTSDKNPPRSMDAGLASVTAMDPGHRIEDRDGSQFSN
ncbi:sugar ABC transporter substrate-binding protein, partial [Francisella sp. 19S2-10]|nr:sugar ABC transporter substrate-binding protein [Francisella sp. 19S2-4]MED7831218.1 sugar ABC transporter substrate-binding protein [Francisella sp. 19S2-10]